MQIIKLYEATSNNPASITLADGHRFSDFDAICAEITYTTYRNIGDIQVTFPTSMLRGTPYNTGGKSFPIIKRARDGYVHYTVDNDYPDTKINYVGGSDIMKTIYGIKY